MEEEYSQSNEGGDNILSIFESSDLHQKFEIIPKLLQTIFEEIYEEKKELKNNSEILGIKRYSENCRRLLEDYKKKMSLLESKLDSLITTGNEVFIKRKEDPVYSFDYKLDESIILGHSEGITCILPVEIDDESFYIITAGKDNLVLIWDYLTGKIIKSFEEHKSFIIALSSYKSDCINYILSAGVDGQIYLWDLSNGNIIKEYHCGWEDHHYFVNKISDDSFLLCNHYGEIKLYKSLFAEDTLITHCLMNRDQELLYSSFLNIKIFGNNHMLICGLLTGEINIHFLDCNESNKMLECLSTFQIHEGEVKFLTDFRRSDKDLYFLSAGRDQKMKIWTIEEGEKYQIKVIETITVTNSITSLTTYSSVIIYGTSDKKLNIKDYGSKLEESINHSHNVPITAVSVLKYNKKKFEMVLITGSEDKSLKYWSFYKGKNNLDSKVELISTESNYYTNFMTVCEMKGDNPKLLITGNTNNSIGIWISSNENSWKLIKTKTNAHSDLIYSLLALEEKDSSNIFFFSASGDWSIKLWKLSRNMIEVNLINLEHIFQGHTGPVYTLKKLQSGILASGGGDNRIELWDLKSKKRLHTLSGHTNSVYCIVNIIGNKQEYSLASGSYDKSIKLWRENNKEAFLTLTGHSGYVTSLVQINSDRIASSSWDKTIRIWNISHKECINVFTGHKGHIRSLIGITNQQIKLIVSVAEDNKVKIWEVGRGECLDTYELNYTPTSVFSCNNIHSEEGIQLIIAGNNRTLNFLNIKLN